MKQNVLKKLLSVLFVLVIMMIPTLVMAQLGDIDPGCDMLDPTCPIDGGLSALLVLGAGYGIKKVRDARKNIIK